MLVITVTNYRVWEMKNGNEISPCNLGLCCDVKSNCIAFYLFGVMLHPLGRFGGMTWTSSTNNEKHFNLLDRTGKIISLSYALCSPVRNSPRRLFMLN